MPREKNPLVRKTTTELANEGYIKKTQTIVNFLMHVFDENMAYVARILSAQANMDTERLIDMLGLVKGRCEDWIEELKKMQ